MTNLKNKRDVKMQNNQMMKQKKKPNNTPIQFNIYNFNFFHLKLTISIIIVYYMLNYMH